MHVIIMTDVNNERTYHNILHVNQEHSNDDSKHYACKLRRYVQLV